MCLNQDNRKYVTELANRQCPTSHVVVMLSEAPGTDPQVDPNSRIVNDAVIESVWVAVRPLLAGGGVLIRIPRIDTSLASEGL
jgi:hypothetical protein